MGVPMETSKASKYTKKFRQEFVGLRITVRKELEIALRSNPPPTDKLLEEVLARRSRNQTQALDF
jgi:hypothetical protein